MFTSPSDTRSYTLHSECRKKIAFDAMTVDPSKRVITTYPITITDSPDWDTIKDIVSSVRLDGVQLEIYPTYTEITKGMNDQVDGELVTNHGVCMVVQNNEEAAKDIVNFGDAAFAEKVTWFKSSQGASITVPPKMFQIKNSETGSYDIDWAQKFVTLEELQSSNYMVGKVVFAVDPKSVFVDGDTEDNAGSSRWKKFGKLSSTKPIAGAPVEEKPSKKGRKQNPPSGGNDTNGDRIFESSTPVYNDKGEVVAWKNEVDGQEIAHKPFSYFFNVHMKFNISYTLKAPKSN